MIEYLFLILAIPTGIILALLTKKEKNIYKQPQYFPTVLWILAIASAIMFTLEKTIALTLVFLFITTFTWNKF